MLGFFPSLLNSDEQRLLPKKFKPTSSSFTEEAILGKEFLHNLL
jgi:hypothetical protein